LCDYPHDDDVIGNMDKAKQWLPGLLQEFIDSVVSDELQASCYWTCDCSRLRSVLSPVLWGIGVSVDRVFGSKWLVQLLARIGFSI
jgi:hypothetical protein